MSNQRNNMLTITKITDLLKISFPIIQAPMAGGATTPELVAAVSNAGGLGSLAAGYMSACQIRSAVKQVKELTKKPFSVNLFVPEPHYATDDQIEKARRDAQAVSHELNYIINSIKPPYTPSFEEQLSVILEEKVPILSFTFGILSVDQINKLKQSGIVLIGTATSLEEAQLLEKGHIDAIVAQGSEAGGHRGTFIGKAEDALMPTETLVTSIGEWIKTPLIAAGGIMDAKGIVASLNSGASAVQMGTAFLCCLESGIHPLYKALLLSSKTDNTTLTRAFSGKLARGIDNKFIQRMRQYENDILDYPIQNTLTSPMRKEAAIKNLTDFMSLWAGQGACLCKEVPAAQLIRELGYEVGLNK